MCEHVRIGRSRCCASLRAHLKTHVGGEKSKKCNTSCLVAQLFRWIVIIDKRKRLMMNKPGVWECQNKQRQVLYRPCQGRRSAPWIGCYHLQSPIVQGRCIIRASLAVIFMIKGLAKRSPLVISPGKIEHYCKKWCVGIYVDIGWRNIYVNKSQRHFVQTGKVPAPWGA